MKLQWYKPIPPATLQGPFTIYTKWRAEGVVIIKCGFCKGTYVVSRGYNAARVDGVPADQYDLVAENVRLMAEMGLYEQAL